METKSQSRKTSSIVTILMFLFAAMASGYLVFKNTGMPLTDNNFSNKTNNEPTNIAPSGNLSEASPVPLNPTLYFLENAYKKAVDIIDNKINNRTKEIVQTTPSPSPTGVRNSNSAPVIENLKNRIGMTATSTPSASPTNTSAQNSTPAEIILSLTDQEFHFLYPENFIKSLLDVQDVIVKNFDSSYKPLPVIENDSQVRLVQEKIITALVLAKIIKAEDAQRFQTTIHYTLPKLQIEELKKQNFSFLNPSFAVAPYGQSNSKQMFISGLVEMLSNFLAPTAQAVCGGCASLPLCFQLGASSPTPGFVIPKAACYCVGCLHGQGCLDFCTGLAAIFDPTTFLCGCG